MKYLMAIFCATFLIPLTANAAPTTWYLDDPNMLFFGGVTYDGTGVELDITKFAGEFKVTWTGPVGCENLIVCSTTVAKLVDSAPLPVFLQLVFSTALEIADFNELEAVELLLIITPEVFQETPEVMYMTTDYIPTPATNPNLPPVPIPAAAWLFGSALLGLGVMKRSKA
jgi:hypothetical protein